jgi:hypothetical protein
MTVMDRGRSLKGVMVGVVVVAGGGVVEVEVGALQEPKKFVFRLHEEQFFSLH